MHSELQNALGIQTLCFGAIAIIMYDSIQRRELIDDLEVLMKIWAAEAEEPSFCDFWDLGGDP